LEIRFPELPPKIAEAQMTFEKDMAFIVHTMSDDLSGKVTGTVPDIQESVGALTLRVTQK
jgi:hypothetical protein